MFPFFFSLCAVPVQSVIYGLKGQQVQLNPAVTGKPEEILWIHNDIKVVEFSGTDEQVYGSYEGRVILDWLTAQLQISDLRLEDSGKYEYEIYLQRKWFLSSFELQVLGKRSITFFPSRFQVQVYNQSVNIYVADTTWTQKVLLNKHFVSTQRRWPNPPSPAR